MMTEEELEAEMQADRLLDPEELDVAALNQDDLSFKWSKLASQATVEADRLEKGLKTLAAQLELACRKDPMGFGLTTATENAVKAAVECNTRYISAVNQYFEARHKAKKFEAQMWAIQQRKDMLELLSDLYGRQYFAVPNCHNLVEVWKAARERKSQVVNDRQLQGARRRGQKED
jgi:hypothetical protein